MCMYVLHCDLRSLAACPACESCMKVAGVFVSGMCKKMVWNGRDLCPRRRILLVGEHIK